MPSNNTTAGIAAAALLAGAAAGVGADKLSGPPDVTIVDPFEVRAHKTKADGTAEPEQSIAIDRYTIELPSAKWLPDGGRPTLRVTQCGVVEVPDVDGGILLNRNCEMYAIPSDAELSCMRRLIGGPESIERIKNRFGVK